jgi:hypothetical protein
LKRYVVIYKKSQKTDDPTEQEDLLAKLDDLYYELSDEDMEYVERHEMLP